MLGSTNSCSTVGVYSIEEHCFDRNAWIRAGLNSRSCYVMENDQVFSSSIWKAGIVATFFLQASSYQWFDSVKPFIFGSIFSPDSWAHGWWFKCWFWDCHVGICQGNRVGDLGSLQPHQLHRFLARIKKGKGRMLQATVGPVGEKVWHKVKKQVSYCSVAQKHFSSYRPTRSVRLKAQLKPMSASHCSQKYSTCLVFLHSNYLQSTSAHQSPTAFQAIANILLLT